MSLPILSEVIPTLTLEKRETIADKDQTSAMEVNKIYKLLYTDRLTNLHNRSMLITKLQNDKNLCFIAQ